MISLIKLSVLERGMNSVASLASKAQKYSGGLPFKVMSSEISNNMQSSNNRWNLCGLI
jgi:hypothetical protein